MIDVNDNEKAAVRAFADYIGQSDKCERYLEAFETKKTVADAYEENPHWRKHVNGNIYFRITYGSHWMMTASEDVDSSLWALVCTREQFEAYVKQQEGEKWTHKYVKDNCYIKVSEPDLEGYIVVLTETDGYMTCQPEDLMPIKPIKPTLTAKEQKKVAEFVTGIYAKQGVNLRKEFEDFCNEHEII